MSGEIVGKIINSRGEYVIRMYTVKEFLQALEAFPTNVNMQIMYLSAISIQVPLDEFVEWEMPDAIPVLNKVAEALRKLTIGGPSGAN